MIVVQNNKSRRRRGINPGHGIGEPMIDLHHPPTQNGAKISIMLAEPCFWCTALLRETVRFPYKKVA